MLLKNLFHLINMFLKDFFLELISVFLKKKLKIWYSKFIFGNKKKHHKIEL